MTNADQVWQRYKENFQRIEIYDLYTFKQKKNPTSLFLLKLWESIVSLHKKYLNMIYIESIYHLL